ncbi:hypothetical protein A5679_19200 [Mycobacterium scrofulaceum]|uniref:Excalibur calcium-binding domain-containing protein n=1 Tax=Mycobacterium scrofulaceum TaxID=1783 RepID=A0A1A2VK56_MYCSC|nr:hypothetical protein A5679_19200 [Mycobacterium scrofulaceum]
MLIAGAIVVGVAGAPATQAAPATTTTSPGPAPTTGASVYYPNCKAACADGVAPIYRGQPGYRSGLDRDGDGIACEVCH